jgi:PGF-pre-PGF domain-containing protein
MREEKRSSLLVLLLMLAMPASGQNFTVSTTVLETTSAEITNFSVVTGSPVDFLFTIHNVGNTNVSVFPEITVFDSNNNTVVQLIYNIQVNMAAGNLKDLKLSWNTNNPGNFTAKLVVFYDNNSKSATSSITLVLPSAHTPAGSGDDGCTGGGVITSEPYANIENAERYDNDLIANTHVTYTFKVPELGIYEIAVTGKENDNCKSIRVEALKGTSKLVTVSPPGTVYKNVNIWAVTKGINEALIRFKVENSWLSSNSLATNDVKMVKWDGSKWVQLETMEISKDTAFTYFEAKTDTFSMFTITGLKGVEVPTTTPAPGTIIQTTTPTNKGILQWGYILIAFILLSLVLYQLMKYKKPVKVSEDQSLVGKSRK